MLSGLWMYNVSSDPFSWFLFLLSTSVSKTHTVTAHLLRLRAGYIYSPVHLSRSQTATEAKRLPPGFGSLTSCDHSACGFLSHASCTHPPVELNSGTHSCSAICRTRSQGTQSYLSCHFVCFSGVNKFVRIHCDRSIALHQIPAH